MIDVFLERTFTAPIPRDRVLASAEQQAEFRSRHRIEGRGRLLAVVWSYIYIHPSFTTLASL